MLEGLYSFSAAMAGIALACFTSIADACDHHKLMSTLSRIIVFSLLSSLCIFILASVNDYRLTSLKYKGKKIDEQKADFGWKHVVIALSISVLSAYFIMYQLMFSVLELPLTPADALTFCEQPDKPDSK